MRTILGLFVQLDTYARDMYRAMADASDDARLKTVFDQMSREEAVHLEWWADLVKAWEKGLIPDVINDATALEDRLSDLLGELGSDTPVEMANLSADEMLQAATRLEFSMLDPVFSELLDLTGPGSAKQHREAYQRHVDRLVGCIEECYSPDPLASFLARVLRQAWKQNQELSTFASRDPLTGLHNRRGMMAHVEQWTAWAVRYGRPITVLLVDVDDFKSINDTCGHGVGDIALQAVGAALRKTVRASDMVARYGGDEFAIIAPETDCKQMQRVVERVLEGVRAIDLPSANGCAPRVTVSVGCACTEPPGTGVTSDALLSAADRSLYDGKRTGKDRAGVPVFLGGAAVT